MRNAAAIVAFVSLLGSPARTGLVAQSQPRGSKAPQEHLNAAADAILKLKSARFSLKREGAPAFLDERTGITFTAARCAYAAPDRVSCNVKVALKNGNDPAVDARVGPRRHLSVESADAAVRQGAARTPISTASCCLPRPASRRFCGPRFRRRKSSARETIQNRQTLHLKGEVSGEKLNPLVGVHAQSRI